MSQTLAMVGENSTEDLFDEAVSCFVNDSIGSAFGRKSIDEDCGSEAITSALTTLEFGIKMYVIQWLTRNFYVRFVKLAGALFTYNVGGSMLNKLKTKVAGKGLVGKSVGKLLGMATASKEKRSELALTLVSEHERSINQGMNQYQQNRKHLTSTILHQKKENDSKGIELFRVKTRTGTWTKSSKDRKVYEKATGYKLKPGESWSKLSASLNNFQEYAISLEDEVINKAQVEFNTLLAMQVEKLRH